MRPLGTRLSPANVAERLERIRWADRTTAVLSSAVRRALQKGPAADALYGVPLGQPVHPRLSELPLGFWTSAALLDLLPATERATRSLIAAGIAGSAPATLTGLADWSVLHREHQRVGIAHAAANAAASALYCASLIARSAGRQRSGKALSFSGLALAGVGGYLGGHLSFRLAAGANHAEPVAHLAGLGWHDAAGGLVGPRHRRSLRAPRWPAAPGRTAHFRRPSVHQLPVAWQHIPNRRRGGRAWARDSAPARIRHPGTCRRNDPGPAAALVLDAEGRPDDLSPAV